MGVLVGDTNGDRFVNAGDALQTRNRSGQATDATNFRSDVNTDGFVNSGDTLIVRANSGERTRSLAQLDRCEDLLRHWQFRFWKKAGFPAMARVPPDAK